MVAEYRIEISSKQKKKLKAEFKTSLTTVQLSLDCKNNSTQAHKIRDRAREMLLIEAAKVARSIRDKN